jgi:hypothetical protein
LPSTQLTGELELDQGVTELYVDTNFAIRPIKWKIELDQGITELYMDANFAIGPIDWILEFNQASLSSTWMPTLPSDQSTGN